MKYVNEYRDPDRVKKIAEALHTITVKPWTVMEVCGGQTHAIMKFSLHDLIPKNIRLIHGPGCPVCVTPIHLIDHALHIAALSDTVLCSFADMVRVPGEHSNLLTAKAKGADVRLINSPLEALKIAKKNPHKQIIYFAVGFETTALPNAMAVYQAKQHNLKNFSMLASHVLVPPALKYLLQMPDNKIQGFLAAGHVCTVTGYQEYHTIAREYGAPIVITGFEPLDILQGLYACIQMLENHSFAVSNQYRRSVQEQGNVIGNSILKRVFKIVDRKWRGIGVIPASGLGLQEEYADYDATLRFPMASTVNRLSVKESGCISGLILQGKKKPSECALFAKQCTPENPVGAPMVSNEGACAAYHQYCKLTDSIR